MALVSRPVAVCLTFYSSRDAPRQEAEVNEYLASKNWGNAIVFKESHQDFIARVYPGEFGVVVVWSLASLARSWRDLVDILDLLMAKGTHLISLRDGIDTTKGFTFETFSGALKQFHYDLRSIQIREGIARAKKQGRHPGRRPRIPLAEVHRLRYLGYTMEDVGRRLGGTKSAVSKILSKHPQPANLPLPPRLKDLRPWARNS